MKQDSEKEKQAGHSQNQKQSAYISCIQSNNACGESPTRYHSPADDRYGCIYNHESRFRDNCRFLFSVPERKYKQEFHHRLRQGILKRRVPARKSLKEKSIENLPEFCAGSHISGWIFLKLLKEFSNGKFFGMSSFFFIPFWFQWFFLRRMKCISQILVRR